MDLGLLLLIIVAPHKESIISPIYPRTNHHNMEDGQGTHNQLHYTCIQSCFDKEEYKFWFRLLAFEKYHPEQTLSLGAILLRACLAVGEEQARELRSSVDFRYLFQFKPAVL